MNNKNIPFTVGSRPSKLALTQAQSALRRIETMLPGVTFELKQIASIGDGDRTTDLRESPANFFTRELDRALLNRGIDCAIHSAKDLPTPMPKGIDWFWLPWREEPRDVLLFAQGKTAGDLPENPVIGISSERRADYCALRFPSGIQKMIRGNIEERIAQLDAGDFDVVVMAAAALIRLNMQERISEWIELDALQVPDGQGHLAITFRNRDSRFFALRNLFVQSVTFAGAGVSDRELCTVATLNALHRAEVCLYDSLIDHSLLNELPPDAVAIDVGKRCGAHSRQQEETTALMCEYARRSKRVVRLKGGDPGIFGRLAEETDALNKLGIAYRIIPGISALQAATTGTGMLLTRRELARGFCVLTPRQRGGGLAPCNGPAKSKLPVVYYMAIHAAEAIAKELLQDGWPVDTPAALIFNAGGEDEQIYKTELAKLGPIAAKYRCKLPGLIIVGDITAYAHNSALGALRGKKVLLTCSEALQARAADRVRDYGGLPIQRPLIRLKPRLETPLELSGTDWLILSSPSSVRCFIDIINHQRIDYRTIPHIMVCGRGTAAELERSGLRADAQPPSDFSAAALIELAKSVLLPGDRVLRLRSEKAGTELADALRAQQLEVKEAIIYDNEPLLYEEIPSFDALFFASASAVESFVLQQGKETLLNKELLVIGQPTADALISIGLTPTVTARESTVLGALDALAQYAVLRTLKNL
jgi:uroporphyrinogen III methyltransferase / synthase